MPDESKPELDQYAIEVHASDHYQAMMTELLAMRPDCRTFVDFSELIRRRCSAHLSATWSPESKAGFLIALTGCIKEYLENEHGTAFTPGVPE